MSEYKYGRIPDGANIRLLKIIGGIDDDIVCELTPAAFGSVRYVALSYVWGSYEPEETMRKIFIQESAGDHRLRIPMAVRRNLYSLLRQLRQPTEDIQCWADAICIDQKNTKEKIFQLALMQDIYQQAQKVIYWLGRHEDYAPEAFRCIRTLRDVNFKQNLVPEKHQQLRCFRELLTNDWFRRRWIVQEVAFSRVAILLSGSCSVYWSVFTEAAKSYFEHEALIRAELSEAQTVDHSLDTKIQPAKVLIELTCGLIIGPIDRPWLKLQDIKQVDQPEASNTSELSEEARSVIEDYERSQKKEYKLTLEDLVETFKMHEVSDYRDTIYALLPLAEDVTNRRPVSSHVPRSEDIGSLTQFPNLRPDYSKNVFEVFKDYSEYCTKRATRYPLDIICRTWVPRSIQRMFLYLGTPEATLANFPSSEALSLKDMKWVYQRELASWMPITDDDHIQQRKGHQLVGLPDQPIYHASARLAADVKFGVRKKPSKHDESYNSSNKSDGSLRIKGVQVDRIEAISSCYEGAIPKDWLLLGDVDDKISKRRRQETPTSLWRTMAADRDLDGAGPGKDFSDAFQKILGHRDEHGNISVDEVTKNHSDDDVAKFLGRVTQVASGRRLFRAEKTKRLGLAPLDAKEQDIICVLYGCSVPVVLRVNAQTESNPGDYQLIGECYFDGMMEGEAVSTGRLLQAKIDRRERVFVLR
jgi:hypothetical protein